MLRKGGPALDAVELACRATEDDPNDHSVGYSGLPNVMGEVELDASIMDGDFRAAATVAAVRRLRGNPITLARQVMEQLPHVLLAGHGKWSVSPQPMGMPCRTNAPRKPCSAGAQRFAHYGLDSEGDADLRRTDEHADPPAELVGGPLSAGSERRFGTVNFLALTSTAIWRRR